MSGPHIQLLALDGGGVRGLSSLFLLQNLMRKVNPDSPPKPCEYFDMIGGTSTGGIIAIMLGRLKMTVEECIDAYVSLSEKVFTVADSPNGHPDEVSGPESGQSRRIFKSGQPRNRPNSGQPRRRFDSGQLEEAIKCILRTRQINEDELLKDPDADARCKVFVCATSASTSDTVCIRNYRSPRSDNSDLLDSVTIWQACRATFASTHFFDPISIGPYEERFVDGELGANNPIQILWGQARDVWGEGLEARLQCIVSIGTGVPNLTSIDNDSSNIVPTLHDIATNTERTAELFHRDRSNLSHEDRKSVV